MRLLREDDDGHPLAESDFPWLKSDTLVLRRHAVEELGDFLCQYGELLPLSCEDADLTVLNVCRVIPALDVGNSSVLLIPNSGRIMKVNTHIFFADLLQDVHVFKVPELVYSDLFVSQRVVDLVQSAGLQGFSYNLVWEV